MAVREGVCAAIAGGACVAGIALSTINDYLNTAAALLSILVAALALRSHLRKRKEDK